MRNLRHQRGVALITSLAILAVVGALVAGAIITTQVELAVSRNDSTSAQAQYVAQAGLQKYKAALFQNFRWLELGASSGGSDSSACYNSTDSGLDFNRDGSNVLLWVNNQIVLPPETIRNAENSADIGTYVVTLVRDPGNKNRITVRSVGRTLNPEVTRQATATANATFIVRNSSTLEQAIWAGTGGSGMKFINGNSIVNGGVYVEGDETDPTKYVIEATGTLSITNGYDKTSQAGNLGFLTTDVLSASNLCAAVRVQHGKVGVGGSTLFGSPSNPLLSVSVNRGIEDVSTDRGGTYDCKSNKGICSETGVRPFDIENPPEFPDLDRSPGTEFCSSPTTWRTCIREEAALDGMTIDTLGLDTVTASSPAGVSLSASCMSALNAAAASSTNTLTLGATSLDCTVQSTGGTVYGFKYTAGTPSTFELQGNINVRGLNLQFDGDTQYRATSHASDGTINKFANLSIEASGADGGSFYAEGDFTSDSAHGAFPNNVMSLVAEEYVELLKNQGYYSLPLYAGTQVRMRGNTTLFGQIITNSWCSTSQGGTCNPSGSPAEITFVTSGENRAKSFRAIAPSGGLPTFLVEGYELR